MRLHKVLMAVTRLGVMPEAGAQANATVPGYDHGQPTLAKAPFTLADVAAIKKTLLFCEEDERALRQSKAILADQTEAILDVWYGFVASTPELLIFFGDRNTGAPDGAYLAAVRKRFGLWIGDTADARFDQAWLDWQYELGLRHNRLKKNMTDQVDSTPQVNFRYLSALTIPVTTTLKPFLAKTGASAADVETMHAAWVKAVLLQTILWSFPYVKEGEF
jgi:Protoglobin